MTSSIQKIICLACVLMLAGVVVNDMHPHFDKSLIELKRKNQSAQRDWSLFYGQRYIYADSSLRYQGDLDAIAELIVPHSLFLSDVSTSYYLAAHLSAYVKNIHRHHGRGYDVAWEKLISERTACYLQEPRNVETLTSFLRGQNFQAVERGLPEIRYIVVNLDRQNINLRQDCLWATRERLVSHLGEVAVLRYQGKNLSLYEVKR